jgi:hypothetical protein
MLYNLDYDQQRRQFQDIIVFIIMKIVIRESRLKGIVVKWLQDRYPVLNKELHTYNISYYDPTTRNGLTVFSYEEDSGEAMFYQDIQFLLRGKFGMSEEEAEEAVEQWIEEYYGLDVSRVRFFLK